MHPLHLCIWFKTNFKRGLSFHLIIFVHCSQNSWEWWSNNLTITTKSSIVYTLQPMARWHLSIIRYNDQTAERSTITHDNVPRRIKPWINTLVKSFGMTTWVHIVGNSLLACGWEWAVVIGSVISTSFYTSLWTSTKPRTTFRTWGMIKEMHLFPPSCYGNYVGFSALHLIKSSAKSFN